jgi:hypothetical protein
MGTCFQLGIENEELVVEITIGFEHFHYDNGALLMNEK